MERELSLSSLADELGNPAYEANNESVGGYDADFVEELDDDFRCVVCLDAMKDPYQIVPCGHRFCRSCLEQLFRSAENRVPTCPNDRSPISKERMFPDNNCRRKIMCLQVCCRKKSEGCKWKSTLSELEAHLANDCLHVEASCSNEGCDEKMLKMCMEEHQTHCEWRLERCPLCHLEFRAFELPKHDELDCPMKLIDCINKDEGCLLKIARSQMENHFETKCEFSFTSCPLQFLGCDEKGTRYEINEHTKEHSHHHLQLLYREFISLKIEHSLQINDLKSRVEHLEKINADLQKTNADLQKTNADLQKTNADLQKTNADLQKINANLQKTNAEYVTHLWMLPNANEAPLYEDVQSPVYATGPRGYCFVGLLHMERESSFISLRFMPGFYDHLLPLPCGLKFTLALLDQSGSTPPANFKENFQMDSRDAEFRECIYPPGFLHRITEQQSLYSSPCLAIPTSILLDKRYLANGKLAILIKIQVYNVEDNIRF